MKDQIVEKGLVTAEKRVTAEELVEAGLLITHTCNLIGLGRTSYCRQLKDWGGSWICCRCSDQQGVGQGAKSRTLELFQPHSPEGASIQPQSCLTRLSPYGAESAWTCELQAAKALSLIHI